MKYLVMVILAFVVAFALGDFIRAYQDGATASVIMADREYWRLMASSPQWLCRARGGKYTLKEFATYFGSKQTQLHWECNEITN